VERESSARALSDARGPVTDLSGAHSEHLDDRDRWIVRDARHEIMESPLPRGGGPSGVLAALGGGVVLVGWPAVSDRVPGGTFYGPFVLLGAALALVGGVAWSLSGDRTGRAAAAAAVEASLRQLESGDGDRETNLRAATLLLAAAQPTQGAAAHLTFQPDAVRRRLGGAGPLVFAVDRYLAQESGAAPIFDPRKTGA
jgi:hypothetical protein